MAYIEISSKKLLDVFKEEIMESQDEDFMDKILKMITARLKFHPTENLNPKILHKLNKEVQFHIRGWKQLTDE